MTIRGFSRCWTRCCWWWSGRPSSISSPLGSPTIFQLPYCVSADTVFETADLWKVLGKESLIRMRFPRAKKGWKGVGKRKTFSGKLNRPTRLFKTGWKSFSCGKFFLIECLPETRFRRIFYRHEANVTKNLKFWNIYNVLKSAIKIFKALVSTQSTKAQRTLPKIDKY